MGREIRKAPKGWEHPKREKYNPLKGINELSFQPLYDESYKEAANNWLNELRDFEANKDGEKDNAIKAGCDFYWDWNGGPPNKEYYRPDWNESDCTMIAVYETVSEGTPVTPFFETKAELIKYLAANGDFWDQKRHKTGSLLEVWGRETPAWGYDRAKSFVESGFSFSMVVVDGKATEGKFFNGAES